jgi:hypothetical protein
MAARPLRTLTLDEQIESARKLAADPVLIPHERSIWQARVRDLIDEQRATEDRETARWEDNEFVGASNGSTDWENS